METAKPLSDRDLMLRAIELAKKCKSEPDRASPNVGAIVARDGIVLGEAFRGEIEPGEHAEFTLLERKLSGETLAGSTLFTTLEPCTSRNPPKIACADRIIEGRIGKVFIGTLDRNPKILGTGQISMVDAGIQIALFDPDLVPILDELNRDSLRQHKAPRRKHSNADTMDPVEPEQVGPSALAIGHTENGGKVGIMPGEENPDEVSGPPDEIDRLEFCAEGLGRCLAGFLNNIRYSYELGKRHDKTVSFDGQLFWERYREVMNAPKEDFEEFVSMKGLKDGMEVDGPNILDLLVGTRNLSIRNKAFHFASILGVNFLLSRNLLDLFEYKNLDFEGVVTKYLSLRDKLSLEVGRKHDGSLGAMILFYMDIGIILYVKGNNTCAQIGADGRVIDMIKRRTEVAIDSAKYFKPRGRQEVLINCALSWSQLFRDKERLVSDLEQLYDDLANRLKLVR